MDNLVAQLYEGGKRTYWGLCDVSGEIRVRRLAGKGDMGVLKVDMRDLALALKLGMAYCIRVNEENEYLVLIGGNRGYKRGLMEEMAKCGEVTSVGGNNFIWVKRRNPLRVMQKLAYAEGDVRVTDLYRDRLFFYNATEGIRVIKEVLG